MPTQPKTQSTQALKKLKEPFPSLEKLLVKELNGSYGSNREKFHKCQITATNDWEAIQIWLSAYQSSTSTARLGNPPVK
jgi:hypothetical protein